MKTLGDISKIINWMNREEVVELLEGEGIACYDSESTDELREALLASVQDGSISVEALEISQEGLG